MFRGHHLGTSQTCTPIIDFKWLTLVWYVVFAWISHWLIYFDAVRNSSSLEPKKIFFNIAVLEGNKKTKHFFSYIIQFASIVHWACLPRVVSRDGLFGLGSDSGQVRAGFGPKVEKNFGLNSGLRRTFCLRCTKK